MLVGLLPLSSGSIAACGMAAWPMGTYEILAAEPPEPAGYFAPTPRAGVGGQRAALLVRPAGWDHAGRIAPSTGGGFVRSSAVS